MPDVPPAFPRPMTRLAARASLGAAALWLAALLVFGALLPGYSQLHLPTALLGARGIPRAWAFDALGFVLPGLLTAVAGHALRDALDARGWPARIGSQLLLVSGLAFAAQGLLPLDAGNLDALASRLHAMAWSLWWIAALAGAALLATRLKPAALFLACLLPLLALCALAGLPALAQRLAVLGALLLPALLARAAQP